MVLMPSDGDFWKNRKENAGRCRLIWSGRNADTNTGSLIAAVILAASCRARTSFPGSVLRLLHKGTHGILSCVPGGRNFTDGVLSS